MKTIWMKALVVTLGLSVAAPALAAPRPLQTKRSTSTVSYKRVRSNFDRVRWSDSWLRQRPRRLDSRLSRLYREGELQIQRGRTLQRQGEELLLRAERRRSPAMAYEAHDLIRQGERLELQGRNLIRRARG